jgi:hypothetical protein
MPATRDEIIAEIRKYVAANAGKIPGSRAFESATRIKESSWRGRYWARWTDAIRDAGLEPGVWNQKIPEDDMVRKLTVYVATLGRFPTWDEINLHARQTAGFPVAVTIKRRFGGMLRLAGALLEIARSDGNDLLAKLCEERLNRVDEREATTNAKREAHVPPLGFVYLKYSPSLRLYKIGKANDPKKRGVGISLLLPHDLIPKHEIRTDCPFLLEKYWEQRFRAKKKQGEWYDLTSAEVETFKSRREFIVSEFFP